MLNIEGFIYGYFLAHFMPGMIFLGALFLVLKTRGIIEQVSTSSVFLFIVLSILFGAIIDGIKHKLEEYKSSRDDVVHKIIKCLHYPFLLPCEHCKKEDCIANKIFDSDKQPWYYSSILGLDILNSIISRFYYYYEFYINASVSLGISVSLLLISVYTLKIASDDILIFSLLIVAILLIWLLVRLGVSMRCNYNLTVAEAISGAIENIGGRNGKEKEKSQKEKSQKEKKER